MVCVPLFSVAGKWYLVPGQGPGGYTQYRVSMGYNNNKVNIFIDKTGTGDIFSQARIIRIYASSESPGGRLNNTSVDFTDYNAVKQYYNLLD
jgi:hypothetical protein